MTTFDRMWSDLEPIGRDAGSGGYRRFAWTGEDSMLREWFAAEAQERGLSLTLDRAGNQWAWHGDPDSMPGLVLGSHLDSVPDGGAFDGPLGVVSAFAALDAVRDRGFTPGRPIGIVNFGDEEGARFGVACAGSRMLTGALARDRACGLADADGITLAEAMTKAGHDPNQIGRDDEVLRRVGMFVELHVEQGRGLVDAQHPIGVATGIWPHGRWRIELPGEANHAGTTRLADRRDALLSAARVVLAAREAAARHDAVATCGKVRVVPNGVNAIPSHVTLWLDARAASEQHVNWVVAEVRDLVRELDGELLVESWSEPTGFPEAHRIAELLDDAPLLDTGAGHDAGVLAAAGVAAGMLFVRNPTGISHSPVEYAEREDCLAGVDALAAVVESLAG